MNRIDLVAICGMPRAGTTFVHDIFANNKLSDRFFALHSQAGRGFMHNPISTCEPRYLNIHFRHNEPITDAIRILVQYWRYVIDNFDATIIYKHPQLIFFGPIEEDFRFRVKYIFCTRKFSTWKRSMMDHTQGGEGVAVESEDSLYRRYWGQDWHKPPGLDDRFEHLYVRMEWYIQEFRKKLTLEQKTDFIYEDLINSLVNIFDMLDLDYNPRQIVKRYWRTRDV